LRRKENILTPVRNCESPTNSGDESVLILTQGFTGYPSDEKSLNWMEGFGKLFTMKRRDLLKNAPSGIVINGMTVFVELMGVKLNDLTSPKVEIVRKTSDDLAPTEMIAWHLNLLNTNTSILNWFTLIGLPKILGKEYAHSNFALIKDLVVYKRWNYVS
jgi:hypothetical protein